MTDRFTSSGEDAKLAALLRAAKPVRDEAREAQLLERIMTAAERSPRLTVVSTTASPVTPVSTPHLGRARRDLWGAASLLAASLVLGVFLGQSPYTEQTVTRLEQVTGITLASASQDLARVLAAAEHDEDD